jgi:hypothetical protein
MVVHSPRATHMEMAMNADEKKLAYEQPEILSMGSFETITAGASDGYALDAAFPAGTPKSDLTFS